MQIPTIIKLREWAHAGIAVLGALMFLQLLIVACLQEVTQGGAHVPMGLSMSVGIAGGILAVVSKFIDSANNALTAGRIPGGNDIPAALLPQTPQAPQGAPVQAPQGQQPVWPDGVPHA